MATVTYADYGCDQCHYQSAWYDRDTRRDILYIACPICGMRYEWKPIFDRKAMQDSPGEYVYKRTKDGSWIWREYYRPGLGAYYFRYGSGHVVRGRFSHILDDDEIKAFVAQKTKLWKENLVVGFVTTWDKPSQTLKVVYGNIPRSLYEDDNDEDQGDLELGPREPPYDEYGFPVTPF